MRTFVSALLGLALFGSVSCTSSSASAADASGAQPAQFQPPHQISPVRPPVGVEPLHVELKPHAPGAACDTLTLDGRNTDLATLSASAKTAAAQNPNVRAQLFAPVSCAPDDVKKVSDALHGAGIKEILAPMPAATAHPLPQRPLPMGDASPDEKAAAQGTTAFATSLYAQLSKLAPGNLFFSPTSVAGALALVDVGAGGKTAAALDAALHTGLSHEKSHQALASLMARYQANRGDAVLTIANRVWASQKLNFKPSYLSAVQSEFGAAAERVDFTQSESARARINAWVSEQTNNKITELIDRGVLGPGTEFVLTNAVYFLGTWQHPFDPKNTSDAPFTLASGQTANAPFMHEMVSVRGAEVGGAQVVELPYGHDGSLAFDLILPTAKNGLPALEGSLSADSLGHMLDALGPARVTLAMPKFKERSQFSLNQPLTAMGLGTLFSGADLSGMTDAGGINISAVVHQAYVDVDEKGTEAAAATAVIGTRMMRREAQMNVTADHPFLFLIRDTATGGILFMGRMADPRA